jgi:hypothetical protein
MSRRLQDCLALASYKSRHGFDRMSFSHVEAHFHDQLRKRAGGSSSVVSSSSSSTSVSDYPLHTRGLESSPINGPLFSDDIYFRGDDFGPRKRARFEEDYLGPTPKASKRKSKKRQVRSQQVSPVKSWKSSFQYPESSPLSTRFDEFRTPHGPSFSFASTIPESPQFGQMEDEEPRLPPTFHSSPPRTPPPSLPRGLRNRKSNITNGEEGADLLLYLATSPSPARPKGSTRPFPPCTPPSKNAQLPSSMLNTPGGTYGLFNTPGQNFNFADFVNVTPSPAQGAFGSLTPSMTRTPLAAKETRRKLNYDSVGSPIATRKQTGLGMELGGELGA